MKLSRHYSRASLIVTIIVLFTGAIVYYFAINYIAKNQLDRDLTEEIDEVKDYVKSKNQLPKEVDFDEDVTVFLKTDIKYLPCTFFDTIYRNPKEKENEPGRAVSGLISLNGVNYKVTITVSRESTEYLIQIIALITLLLTISLLTILLLTNKYVLNGLWKPFYDTLQQLKALSISDSKSLELKQNKVDEFTELNEAVYSMSSRVKNDYKHLKHFTENASHEMMTPLAVIISKLDMLIQDDTLKPEHFEQINDIYAATSKLSRLNQTLLLLVKIENNLLDDAEPLSLGALIIQKTKQFQELMLAKDIIISQSAGEKIVIASKSLIDILLNNLYSNAIRHNINGGKIIIEFDYKTLIFRNEGVSKPLAKDFLFERFQKSKTSDGTGLGLTIVKNICNLYAWDITYSFENSMHAFQISFLSQ